MTEAVDEHEIVGAAERRRAPKRGKTKRNLDKKVLVRTPGKRGPKPTSNKIQVSVRMEPNVVEAFQLVEDGILAADRSLDRNDVMRMLLDTYRAQDGAAPVPPDIPDADRLVGRTETIPAYVHPETVALLRDASDGSGKSVGEVVEIIIQRSSKLDAVRDENEKLKAELAKYRGDA